MDTIDGSMGFYILNFFNIILPPISHWILTHINISFLLNIIIISAKFK